MAHMSAVFLLLFRLSLHLRAEEIDPKIIPLSSSLSPRIQPSSWASPSGHFEFGFYREGSGFAIGIWIVGRQGQNSTVVWTVNRDDPPLSSNATLELTRQGDLVLTDEYGIHRRNYSGNADSASMLDSGNFVLYNNGSIIWQSFDYPTDTLLGGQNLSRELMSSVSSSNHSTGRYLLRLTEGNLVASLNNSAEVDDGDEYYSINTEAFYRLNLNEEGSLVLYGSSDSDIKFLANSSRVWTKSIPIYRATLDPDGIFRIYSHQFESNNTSSNGTKEWQNLDDPCLVKGRCGLNSYCSSRGGSFKCYCYPGFTFMDENMKFLGCSQNFTIDACEERKDEVIQYNITKLDNLTWNGFRYSIMQSTVEECKKACEHDCYCGGTLYSGGNCEMYSLPLRYGIRGNISTTAFIKIIHGSTVISPSSRSSPSPLVDEESKALFSTMGISLGSVAFFCLLTAISSLWIYRHRVQSYRMLENKCIGLTEQFTLQSFSFSELDKATDGFKEGLGKGSFGAVYKGILAGDHNDNRTIAVKKLDEVNEGDRKFRTEIAVIGRTNHRNLVRLLGFCAEGSRKLLVYEYLSNGSLANFLFSTNEERLIWKERARIALDVAKGILYLHEECEVCIIHSNIKPQNILLDDFMTAKVSDFGLAKLRRPNQTSIIKGTTRYLAPEWQRNSALSVKVDVYSFGVILLEIICCRSSLEVEVSSADEILLSTWVYYCFVAGELNKLVEGEQVNLKMLERFVKVGLWCIQDDPDLRPLMKNVTLMLEGTMDVPDVPPLPSYSHVTNY